MDNFDGYLVEAFNLSEPDENGKRHRIGRPVHELHRDASYANTAAGRLKFGDDKNPNAPTYNATNVYGITMKQLKWVGKENGYYG